MSFFFQAEDGIRDLTVTGVQTCALPICTSKVSVHPTIARTSQKGTMIPVMGRMRPINALRSEEHTSELQSQSNLVCRLLLEKKKITRLTASIIRPINSQHSPGSDNALTK